MKVSHDFPLAPAELFTVLTDHAYLAARLERFGGIGEPTVENEDDEVVVTTKRQLPLDKVPGAFRGFVGDGQILQIDRWQLDGDSSPSDGKWSATVGNAPAEIGGTHEIREAAEGSNYSIGIEVSIKIPFIGKQFEPQVASYLENLISKDLDYLGEWIAKQ